MSGWVGHTVLDGWSVVYRVEGGRGEATSPGGEVCEFRQDGNGDVEPWGANADGMPLDLLEKLQVWVGSGAGQ